MLLIDYEILDNVKIKTDELPLSLLHYTLNHEYMIPYTWLNINEIEYE